MSDLKTHNFNIEPLVFEIQNVIKKGLSTILKDYTDRYELLEKTHNQIMRLPSVLNELNNNSESDKTSDNDLEEDKSNFISIKDMTHNIVREEIEIIENRLDKMEKKFDSIVPILDKILGKMQTLNEDVKGLKNSEKQQKDQDEYKTVYMTHTASTNLVIKPSIVTSSEDENIKFEIEADIESGNEDEDEDEDDNDVNPAMITCSTINIKTLQHEEEEEESVEEELEEEELEEELEEEEESVEEESVEEESVEEELVEEELVEEELVEEELVEEELVEELEEESVVEEQVVVDEIETEASDEEEEEKDEEKEEEDEEDELIVITIDDIDYCTNNEENGFIYELNDEGEQGDKIGYLKEGEPFFYSDEK
jgi:hypothetical protein